MSGGPITEADLQAHVDGRLPEERERAVRSWLAQRPEEADRVAAYRRQGSDLRDAFAAIHDEPIPASLDLGLHGARTPRAGQRFTTAGGLGRPALAASAALLFMLGAAGGWIARGSNPALLVGTASIAREAAMSWSVYANDPARPVEMKASDRSELDTWFSRRLARSVRAPDLSGAGLSLIGGRLVATEHGPGGLYLYADRGGRRIAVFMRPMQVEGEARMQQRDHGGVRGWTWAQDGMGFGVYGDAPANFLHGAADIVRDGLHPV